MHDTNNYYELVRNKIKNFRYYKCLIVVFFLAIIEIRYFHFQINFAISHSTVL